MKKIALAVIGAVALVAIGFGTWMAVADDEVADRGVCGANAYELSVDDEDGSSEVSFELQANAPGETWTVLVEQAGDVLLEGERVTDEDAELDLDAPALKNGGDEFTVTATPATGDACTATITR